MNSSSNVDPGGIRIGNRELGLSEFGPFGPSPVAFALRAFATSGLTLRSSRVERRILFFLALVGMPLTW